MTGALVRDRIERGPGTVLRGEAMAVIAAIAPRVPYRVFADRSRRGTARGILGA
jgi:hypothetical protein